MILEHRTYTFKPGTVDGWVKKYETEGLAIQRRHLNRYVGLYVTEIGHLHTTVLMWVYDSLADRESRRERLGNDPAWQKYIREVWALDAILSQDVRIMKPSITNP